LTSTQRRLGGVLAVTAALLIGCREDATVKASLGTQLAHPNGLQLMAPPGATSQQRADGFALTVGGESRTPLAIVVELAEAAPVLASAQERTLGTAAVARSAVHQVAGGSGGVEYQLQAATAARARWIVMTATVQSERGEPSFVQAWEILASARLATER